MNADGRDKRDGLTCERHRKMWQCLVQVVAWQPSVELLKFLRLLCSFGGNPPPKGQSHFGDLQKALNRNEVHCILIGVQNIEVGNRTNMDDTIQANMRLC